jgi:putative transposase
MIVDERLKPQTLSVSARIDEVGSIDFIRGHLTDGRAFRLFNVLDECNLKSLSIQADFSLRSVRLIRVLDQIISWRIKPKVIRCDNGTENISGALQSWADRRGIPTNHIQPGNPQQNGFIERFNRRLRYDQLAQHAFDSIEGLESRPTGGRRARIWAPESGLGWYYPDAATGHDCSTLLLTTAKTRGVTLPFVDLAMF